MKIQSFLKLTQHIINRNNEETYVCRPAVITNDGRTFSIQASTTHYSTPREGEADTVYTHVEIAGRTDYPLLAEYADCSIGKDGIMDGVFAYVPVALVDALIHYHGGFRDINDCSFPWDGRER